MESEEIQAIRAARAQQLKQESEAGQSASSGTGGPSAEDAQRSGAEEARRDILASLLEPTARERCLFASLRSELSAWFWI